MRYQDTELLSAILRLKKSTVSTTELATLLDISQQSASRKLRDIESKGLITRELCSKGQKITVLDKGHELISSVIEELKEAISNADTSQKKFTGYITSGSGEGSYYLSQSQYHTQLTARLGFSPFKGTLNLEIRDNQNLKNKEKFLLTPPITIKGFTTPKRTFGQLLCYRCSINKMPAAIIIPQRTHHNKKIVEIIAEDNLRKTFNQKDGDKLEVAYN
ncbi:MAG: riboflavin kinase [Candidatus Nanohalarchaeota archaeon]|nr:MAG: riboflavin kinase [Candidatus Nanohaloarchaeota archaeon]